MKLLAIDGNSILNRAFYGIKLLTNKKGEFTNAIFGFMNIYLRNIGDIRPDAVAVAFDLRTPTFRHKAVSYYKANRKGMPPELAEQLPKVKKLLELMGVKVVECEGYEADDVLGTLSKLCSDSGNECYVLTGDRDSLQLIDDKVTVVLATNKENIYYTPEKFNEDYGFEPIKLIDLKALMGDSSDNIPGVAGIGEKTASALIKEYGCIENLYENYEASGLTKGVKAKLAAGAEAAKESKWLATIVRDAPIDNDLSSYIPVTPDTAAVSLMLSELEMFKLLDKLGISATEGTNSASEAKAEEAPVINAAVSELTKDIICRLTECEYLFRNEKLSVRDGSSVYTSENENTIRAFLASDCNKSTDDAKAHYRWAMAHGSELRNLRSDAAICGYLLNTSASDYAVDKLCAEYGTLFYSENGELAELLSLRGLIEKLRSEIAKEGMTDLLEKVEMPLTEVLASMEDTGILIDRKGVEDFGTYLTEMIEETQQMVFDDAGHEFNISSPKQLGTVLFEEMGLPAKKKTKSGYSTNAEVLEELRNYAPIVDNVLKYRQYTKLNSTYVAGLLDKIAPDGRIHTWFRQTETRTGRISSTEPNMQNIPVRTELGAQMRKFFTAAEGKTLIDADYSQIELRVMAHLCGDDNMIEAFNSGEDIHTSTAAQVFDMPLFMVTPEMRSAAKAVNFGIIYGIGAFSLAKDINTSVAKAKKYIADYLAKYPKVDKFMEDTVNNAFRDGYVTTMFGRKRRIPELSSSNKVLQAAGKRIAMNTPVQGTAADLIKIAMINVYNRLKAEKLDAKLILQVHDELIIESDTACAEKCAEILREEMQGVYEMRVPLAVDVHTGHSWYDAKG
ncbi:DNA polymerase I [Ruminococcus flavefaciens]|uniref:DNA polymerase I n=1 Tax=Ruminococcus flavefaciens 007c TaxID=1341157 RepID=W7UH89_RUMFL|nr:DNA polymerase I [Ruminococcus flavefaciens]EWM54576.1 DNA polymerase I [Ruminococcus flavefaciens 007c]